MIFYTQLFSYNLPIFKESLLHFQKVNYNIQYFYEILKYFISKVTVRIIH